MAIIKEEDIRTEEEQRHDISADAFLTDAPSIPGFACVRHFTPLVMVALHKANNPYITGTKGFEAMGVDIDLLSKTGKQDDESAKQAASDFALRMMPKTGEVLVLLTCSREELKQFAKDSDALESAAMDLVEGSTMEALATATMHISQQQQMITKTQAVPSAKDETPDALADKKNGAKKKPVVSGLPTT